MAAVAGKEYLGILVWTRLNKPGIIAFDMAFVPLGLLIQFLTIFPRRIP